MLDIFYLFSTCTISRYKFVNILSNKHQQHSAYAFSLFAFICFIIYLKNIFVNVQNLTTKSVKR